MLSERSDLAWVGRMLLNSVESFIIAAGSVLRGLCQFFVLKDKSTFKTPWLKPEQKDKKTQKRCKQIV